jgi:hypothetical protein
MEMGGELLDTFKKSQVFRTRVEMEVSVLNEIKFPTPHAKYWQSVREQNVMLHELVMLSYDYRENAVKLKRYLRELEAESDELKRELLEIKRDRVTFVMKNQEKVAKDRIRELKMWSEIKEREAMNLLPEETENIELTQLIWYTKRWMKQFLNMSPTATLGERNNLIGQLRSGVKRAKELGIWDKVSAGFTKGDLEHIYRAL